MPDISFWLQEWNESKVWLKRNSGKSKGQDKNRGDRQDVEDGKVSTPFLLSAIFSAQPQNLLFQKEKKNDVTLPNHQAGWPFQQITQLIKTLAMTMGHRTLPIT